MYNIQLASSLSGINVHNLRAWERRYSAVSPKRDEVGRRLYSKENIEKLFLLNQLVKEGTAIRHIAEKTNEELTSLVEEKGLIASLDFEQSNTEKEEIELTYKAMAMAMNFKKFDIVSHELSKAIDQYDLKKVVFEILTPFLFDLRDKLDKNRITLEEKHTLITLTKYFLRRKIYQNNSNINRNSVVIATPAGDQYELQALIAALLLSGHGRQVVYLGANVEARTIVDTVEATGVENILVWGSCLWNEKRGAELGSYFNSLNELAPKGTKIGIACNGKAPYEFFTTGTNMKVLPNYEKLSEDLEKQSIF
ncbi:hypothetical protein BIY24_04745 [Halobacteriovorax marinus]|uniref:MerR-family regulatory protein n=1 Tax=Halobacteriovorax marinus (strain ATCC BAA-682 / DSM 15412 / SJ) TaxID=862908 RepID=E1WXT4_HALMS|nr:MerR family transcriptional regulator [Halobacteriovorax marinus]ATH07266.1 hypothetical protein BIY24_04745 [Halobacteriovorax marinus]CBW25891.1 putative MerR-family regulatory protein [Halobacteriovorax marinus SJ]